MSELHKNLIGGEWVSGAKATRNINPSNTNDIVGEYAQADTAQTLTAIAAARGAAPGWSRSTPQERHDALKKVSDEILSRREELGELLAREEGKTRPEGIGEVARAGQIFDFFAGEALRLTGEKVASVRPGIDVEMTREAVGVVGIIAPWNFPIAIPAWKIAPALCYGNAVVFKPADLVPGSAHALSEIISRSGLPAGVFNLVMGRGSVVGEALLNSRDVDAITFTGSVATGRKVASACVGRMAKFQLEMGGKNPLIVLDDADLKVSVEAAVNGAFFSTGTIMSEARRHELLKLSEDYRVPIFEDDCYADLIWDGQRPPALHAMSRNGGVIHIGSFSKSIAPALRVGYIVAPWEALSRMLALKTDAGSGALEQMVLAEYCTRHFTSHVPKLTRGLRAKLETLMDALAAQFGTAAEFDDPKGGIFLWVKLPDHVDTLKLYQSALAADVAFNPGPEWSTDKAYAGSRLRLCFASPSHGQIREGVALLAEICRREFGVPTRSANVERAGR